MRLFFCAIFIFHFVSSSLSLASEVLIVTWQGKTRGEVAFEKRLKVLRPGVKFKYIDAGRKKVKLKLLLEEYNFASTDLVYSYGTTGTKIVKKHLNGRKPHVFNIVSTPLRSGIVKSLEAPGNNITGAKLLVDLEEQLKFLRKIKKYKTLGIWFDPREAQSSGIVTKIFKLCDKWGVKASRFRFIPDAGKVQKTLKKLSSEANKLDALYVIGSSSYTDVYPVMFKDLDPTLLVMGSVFRQVGFGATVALASSYDERGATVAEQAHQILSGKPAGAIPVSVITPKNAFLYVDPIKAKIAKLNNLNALGVKIIETAKPVKLKQKK